MDLLGNVLRKTSREVGNIGDRDEKGICDIKLNPREGNLGSVTQGSSENSSGPILNVILVRNKRAGVGLP